MLSEDRRLPAHLTPLVPSEWGLWRWFALRGAGFPAHLIARLTGNQCATAADQLLAGETTLQSLWQEAIRALDQCLDDLRQQGLTRQDAIFKATLRARRQAQAGKLSPSEAQVFGLAALFQKIETARAEQQQRHQEFQAAFAQSIERQSQSLWEIARNPLFQEAVLWQNRHAFETGIQPIAGQAQSAAVRNQRQREHEQLIANYLQRYCVKNDTIGFFGPIAWGEFVPGNAPFETRPGPALVKARRTYFEAWAINQVATSLSSTPGMEWWSPPRLAPHFHLEGGMLNVPGSEPMQLSPLAQAVLPLCNGENLPIDILSAIHRDPLFLDTGRQELLDLLQSMAGQNILLWRLVVPVEVNSEINLRNQLLRVQDAQLRQTAMGKLEKLEAAREKVSAAGGDPGRLHSALRNLEAAFEEITQTPGQRNAGATYGGRTLVYEDCQRDLALGAAPELLRPIVPALSVLLTSLRWLMQSTSLSFLRIFQETYRELVVRDGAKDVSALAWWMITEPRLIEDPAATQAERIFARKWGEVLPLPPGVRIVSWESRELRERVEQAFPDLPGHYHPVRYYCPDLLVTGADAEAIGRGQAQYVLGEIHSGKSSLIHAALVAQHPDPSELVRATEWDLSPGCFKIAESLAEGKATTRTSEMVLRPADYFLSTTPDAMAPSGFVSQPFSNLLVTEHGGRLMATTRDGSRSFEILEAFADLLFSFVIHKATWLPRARYLPRVMIDQLVIQRETWRMPVEEMEFVMEKEESLRFLGARGWAKKHGVPQTMFVKVPVEVKPFYVDLSSPVYVEILCKMVRRLKSSSLAEREVTFCEMLPRMADAWLPDGSGAKYTSELRFAIVDLKARACSEEYKRQYACAEP